MRKLLIWIAPNKIRSFDNENPCRLVFRDPARIIYSYAGYGF